MVTFLIKYLDSKRKSVSQKMGRLAYFSKRLYQLFQYTIKMAYCDRKKVTCVVWVQALQKNERIRVVGGIPKYIFGYENFWILIYCLVCICIVEHKAMIIFNSFDNGKKLRTHLHTRHDYLGIIKPWNRQWEIVLL